ncbi:uncharacterized protein LOC116396390 isoform X2 [Anarrhichthys ocellatus]|uniref:uncharacterized protein LOC116396390 isoform X2 n=1 Tax=Anarrhichthys ocellatus TaxID=433405 RepID=UPI0012EE36A2|nr:uncharacterized protein LOC116396390 isoform X2 [Anarrhichthys ocellatus]
MEELKRLLGTLHSFHKCCLHTPPLSHSVLFSATFFSLCHTHTSLEEGNTADGLHIPRPASAMAKKDCPAGKRWDSLVSTCIQESETRPEPGPSAERSLATVVQLRSTAPTAHSVMLLSPALWIFVVLATLGSILALSLWFIIYKQQTRHISTSEEAGLQQEPLQKTEPPAKSQPPPSERNGQAEMLQIAAWTPSPCSHLHLGAQTGNKWEEGFTASSDPAKHAGTEGFRGLPTSSTTRGHRIPLPATELGGTVLVTTKTV